VLSGLDNCSSRYVFEELTVQQVSGLLLLYVSVGAAIREGRSSVQLFATGMIASAKVLQIET
jgi:hypothetical protein